MSLNHSAISTPSSCGEKPCIVEMSSCSLGPSLYLAETIESTTNCYCRTVEADTPPEMFLKIVATVDLHRQNRSCLNRECVICGSKAVGINFGVSTCAPCKAFFRRNARRKEVLAETCQHRSTLESTTTNDIDNRTRLRCSHIRQCKSCRLRRCFEMGMKEELVRTNEENERHKQLVKINRQRRFSLQQQEQPLRIQRLMITSDKLLSESDWRHLSNIKAAYETYCLEPYIQRRDTLFSDGISPPPQKPHLKVQHHARMTKNAVSSLTSFLSALPAFRSLSLEDRSHLCQNNIRLLLFPNSFEIGQACFTEPWQAAHHFVSSQYVFGQEIMQEFCRIMELAKQALIGDPVVLRLWLIILFFSSRLLVIYESSASTISYKSRPAIVQTQNAYVTLLWNYLLHRHGYLGAVNIYSHLVRVYLQMQIVGHAISQQVRTRSELSSFHKTLERVLILTDDDQ